MSIRKILFLAVAGIMISPALMAADIGATSIDRTFSDEFLGTHSDSGEIAGNILEVTLGAEYTLGDIITLDFSGAALVGSSVPTIAPADLPTRLVLGLLSADTGQAVFRVTAATACATVPCDPLKVRFGENNEIMFNARDVQAAGGVTVSYSAETNNGIALDTGGDARQFAYIKVADEYSIDVDAFTAVIDVEKGRTTFAGTIEDDTSSVTVGDAGDPGGEIDFGTTLTNVDIVWSGNFGWIFDGDAEMDDVQFTAGVVVVTEVSDACTSIVVTAATIAATCPGAEKIDLKLAPAMNLDDEMLAILPSTSFTVAVTVNYMAASSDEGSRLFSEGAGRWTLNGFQAFLPYMPYGPSISQVIYLVNRGSQSGALIVDWVDQNGNSDSLGEVATLGPNTTLAVGPIIDAALEMEQRTSGRLGLTITANVPAADVQISAQYNDSGNRGFVLHEDNRPCEACQHPQP